MKNMIRLPLHEIFNLRDLGGYPINENAITKWSVFYRSADLPSNLSSGNNDVNLLYKYGIRTVINLKNEGFSYISPVQNDKRFNYVNIPLVDDFNKIVGSMYTSILTIFSKNLKDVFVCIHENLNGGGILFHCQSGKDRTGVIAALLLALLGVSELDIIANYMVSEIYVRPYAKFINRPIETMPSPAVWIENDFIEYIKKEHDNTKNYLKHIGLSDKILSDIHNAFYETITEET